MEVRGWKRCSSCKKEINFQIKYWVCSVSTCNGKRTGYVFCSIPCFERHLPGARHKSAYAVEEMSPSRQHYQREQTVQVAPVTASANATSTPVRRIVPSQTTAGPNVVKESLPKDILVVVSKLKEYIQTTSGMNTSASCIPVLSDLLRQECDKAIEKARQEGRKTVLDRDFR